MTTWELLRGDSLGVLAGLPDETADAIVTDPPYSSGGSFRSDRTGSASAKYLGSSSASLERLPDFHGDNRTERGMLLWCALWMGEAWRVTKTGGAIAVFTDWRSLPTISDALQAGGWSWRGVGVWVKPPGKSRPTMGGLWNDTEFIAWGSKGPRTTGECLPGTWNIAAPGSRTRLHVTEKPQPILRDLVRLAPPGGLVIDPFTGSAATGVAALEQGRRFLGVELSTEYAEIGRRRLAALDLHGADVTTVGPSNLFDQEPVA